MRRYWVLFFVLPFLLSHGLFAEGEKSTDGQQAAKPVIEPEYSPGERSHWSFQKRTRPSVPQFKSKQEAAWVQNPIDAFVLKNLKAAGLQPAPAADRRTLVRRLYFDLLGLPPSPAEIEKFLADESPRAYENLIEELLASKHYGEHWGQHWLDVVRFAETEGFEYDRYRPGSWKFRDYVISAFNADKPFDQFIREQLAGDELVEKSADSKTALTEKQKNDLLVAVGFHRLGAVRRNAGNADVAFSRNEVLTEMTDIVGSAFLGLTLHCCRCHDHKFDPIRQKDYYRLQAFMAATQENDISQVSDAEKEAWQKQTDDINAQIKKLRVEIQNKFGAARKPIAEKIAKLETSLPAPLPTVFSVANKMDSFTSVHLLDRGDEFKKLEPVGIRAIGVLIPEGTDELPAKTGHPKTILADWLTQPDHSLVARVFVNRVWLNHFGRGIVSTPNDFGLNGDWPTHPELLDWLANTFVENGWKVKDLHRVILTSNTYKQSVASPLAEKAAEIDPQNELYWHFSRRRLSAEEVRDSMLVVSGKFNPKSGGQSIMVPVDQELVDLLYKPSQWQVNADESEHYRRSVYLIAKRNLRLPFLEMFDQPGLQLSCAQRVSSTHAPQTLEMLNGKFSNEMAAAFADRLKAEAGTDTTQQIQRGFLLATGKPPTERQLQQSVDFLKTEPLQEFALALLNLNTFFYVD